MSIQTTFMTEMMMLSPNIKSYFDRQLYHHELEAGTTLTDEVAFNLTMQMTVNELKEFGIIITVDDSAHFEVDVIKSILELRRVVTEKSMHKLLAGSENLIDYLEELIEGDEYDSELLIHEVVDFFYREFPLALRWQLLTEQKDIYKSNQTFDNHLLNVVRTASIDGNDLDMSQDLLEFTTKVAKHNSIVQERIDNIIHSVWPVKKGTSVKNAVKLIMSRHNVNLPSIIDDGLVLHYLHEPFDNPLRTRSNNDLDVISDYKRMNLHFLNNLPEEDSPKQTACIFVAVCSLYEERLSHTENVKFITEHATSLKLNHDVLLRIDHFIDYLR